ncbi:hypothetical protein [Sphingosinicella terrae]|uniref:hypothetical protein n=1 Tax=Sphingosinicella terrae TaxID=2172047 RepID=UPI000E0DD412|nr:hypothetical protein [Sphingosinicella terrae]
MRRRIAALMVVGSLLAGCVPRTATGPGPAPAPQPRPYSTHGLEHVLGSTARALSGRLGRPDLDLREGNAHKLQYMGPACVLDAYLYPPRGGGEPVVTHVDARQPDGREMDRSSCVAALTARQQSR